VCVTFNLPAEPNAGKSLVGFGAILGRLCHSWFFLQIKPAAHVKQNKTKEPCNKIKQPCNLENVTSDMWTW